MRKIIVNGTIFDGLQTLNEHAVIIENDRITDIVSDDLIERFAEDVYDLGGNILCAGFIDIQVNGGGGIMFNDSPSPDTLRQIFTAHRKFGTTGMLPTLITTDFSTMKTAISCVQEAISSNQDGILGIHLEGPFLSKEKKGAHDWKKFCKLDGESIELLTSLSNGVTLLTIAPELTNVSIISELKSKGIVLAAGHSNASYDQTLAAVKEGLEGFTHLYNAMRPIESREPGMVGVALSRSNTWFGIIADGFHVHPATFKISVTSKSGGTPILVTDAMGTVGSESDYFLLDGQKIYARNGKCENAAGSLAGSDLDMNTAVLNTMRFANVSWQDAIKMASLNPAKAIGLDDTYGYIKPGYKANLVELNQRFQVVSTWVNGQHETS